MSEYLTEQEQVEILKNWIKQYSVVILGGVLIAAIVITGWRFWQERQYKILSHASAVFDDMLTVRGQNDQTATDVQANKLFTHYSKTTYGQFAALMLARDAIVSNNKAEAKKQLQWVIDHSSTPSFRQIARIRLARILIAENKPEESIKLLSKIDDKTFNGLTNEVKGDAYFAMKSWVAARDAYKQALDDLPNAESARPLLQMKFDNLATAS